MKKVDFDDYVDEYDDLTNQNVSFFSNDESYFARVKAQLVVRYHKTKPGKILEYGAGIGRNLKFLQESFPDAEVWACDISKKSLQRINESYPQVKTFLLGEQDCLVPEKFDLIFVAGVYHHLEPSLRVNVTKQIAGFMNDHAEVFVFEHNPYNPVTTRLVDRCPYDADAILLTPGEIRKLMQEVGLKVKPTRYYLFFPPFLRLGVLENFLSMIPVGGQYFVRGEKL